MVAFCVNGLITSNKRVIRLHSSDNKIVCLDNMSYKPCPALPEGSMKDISCLLSSMFHLTWEDRFPELSESKAGVTPNTKHYLPLPAAESIFSQGTVTHRLVNRMILVRVLRISRKKRNSSVSFPLLSMSIDKYKGLLKDTFINFFYG